MTAAPAAPSLVIRDRIRGLARLPPARVKPHPKNARRHDDRQRTVLRALLADVGVVGALLVVPADAEALAALREAEGEQGFARWLKGYKGAFLLADGHMRREEIAGTLTCLVLDLVAREMAEVLALLDPIGALARTDAALLDELTKDAGPLGDEVTKLLSELGAGAAPPVMPGADVEPPVLEGDDARLVDVHDLRAPFPWFGGKSRAAPIIWGAFGDVKNYVEPFGGSLATLLARPGGPGKVETVNDLDAWVANFWRAVAADPEAVAAACDWPVNETDLHARHKWLLGQTEWRRKMLDDPDHFDAKIAGWWVWGCCAWIGSGWCADRGKPSEKLPRRDSGASGVHSQRVMGPSEQIPHLSSRGMDAHSPAPSEQLPHLGNAGRGVHRVPTEQLPHLQAGSRGVHRASLSIDDGVTENIRAILRELRDRTRRVRVACGPWERVLSPAVTTGHGLTGVLLDPPYAEGTDSLYGNHDKSVSAQVRAWAIEHGNDPDMRIAFCGYDGEHEVFPAGWRCIHWKAQGGYGSGNGNPYRERIWLSPNCLAP